MTVVHNATIVDDDGVVHRCTYLGQTKHLGKRVTRRSALCGTPAGILSTSIVKVTCLECLAEDDE